MTTKYLTKAKLIAINNRAKKAGGNHIDPDFVAILPERYKHLASISVSLDNSWVRCWVTVGADDPPVSENIHTLLVDMRHKDFDKLPSLPEMAEVQK
jgi:hypothetical protein